MVQGHYVSYEILDNAYSWAWGPFWTQDVRGDQPQGRGRLPMSQIKTSPENTEPDPAETVPASAEAGNWDGELKSLVEQAKSSSDSKAVVQLIDEIVYAGGPTAQRALGDIASDESVFLQTRQDALYGLERLSPPHATTEPLLHQILERPYDQLRMSAVYVMLKHNPRAAKEAAFKDLESSESDDATRSIAAGILASDELKDTPFSEAELRTIWIAFMANGAPTPTTDSLVDALGKTKSPLDEKLKALIDSIVDNPWCSIYLFDTAGVARALGCTPANRLRAGTDVIVGLCKGDPELRLVELAAAMLTCVATGGPKEAARLLEDVLATSTEVKELGPHLIQSLRVEIGGSVAMRPLIQALANTVSEPLSLLRMQVTRDYHSTMSAAVWAFWIRVAMSVTVFTVGLAITIASVFWAVEGQPENLLQPLASLAAGLGSMFAVVYAGPLKDIRDSVKGRAAANMTFASYMHSLEFTSAFYASEYLKGGLSQSLVADARGAVGAASTLAVELLKSIDAKDGTTTSPSNASEGESASASAPSEYSSKPQGSPAVSGEH